MDKSHLTSLTYQYHPGLNLKVYTIYKIIKLFLNFLYKNNIFIKIGKMINKNHMEVEGQNV